MTRHPHQGNLFRPRIDPELRDLLPPLTRDEREQLRANLIEAGRATEALPVWAEQSVLLDGHHRLELCEALGLPYDVRMVSLPSRAEAIRWIVKHQLGRRNLTPDRLSYLRGQLYNASKGSRGGDRFSRDPSGDTSERIAGETGVSRATVKRDGQYAAALDALPEPIRRGVLSGQVKASRAEVEALAGAEGRVKAAAARAVEKGAARLPPIDAPPGEPAGAEKAMAQRRARYCGWWELLEAVERGIQDEVLDDRAAVYLKPSAKRILDALSRAKEAILEAAPANVCPACAGQGCEKCRQAGFVTRRGYQL